jgi:hypothetical protein
MSYIDDDETRNSTLAISGSPDDGSVRPGAVDLNNLDDRYEFHQAVGPGVGVGAEVRAAPRIRLPTGPVDPKARRIHRTLGTIAMHKDD